MSVQHFPDGIKIGPDASGNDRLPLFEFDEWLTGDGVVIGTMDANEVKTVVIEGVGNLRLGQTIVKAGPQDPANAGSEYDHLLVLNAWMSGATEISVRVRNLHSQSVSFPAQQWLITHLNTSNP